VKFYAHAGLFPPSCYWFLNVGTVANKSTTRILPPHGSNAVGSARHFTKLKKEFGLVLLLFYRNYKNRFT